MHAQLHDTERGGGASEVVVRCRSHRARAACRELCLIVFSHSALEAHQWQLLYAAWHGIVKRQAGDPISILSMLADTDLADEAAAYKYLGGTQDAAAADVAVGEGGAATSHPASHIVMQPHQPFFAMLDTMPAAALFLAEAQKLAQAWCGRLTLDARALQTQHTCLCYHWLLM